VIALRRQLRSLQGRVALLATLGVAAVLFAVGAAAVASFAERERERVDDTLEARPVGALVRALQGGNDDGGNPGGPGRFGPGGRFGPPALRPEGEYIRLLAAGGLVAAVDAPDGLALPAATGLRTLDSAGGSYRSLTRPVGGGGLLEVGTDLSSADDRVGTLRRRLVVLGLLGVGLVGALSWWLAGLALRPLRALQAGAGRVSSTRDLSTRLDAEPDPREVGDLSDSINAMLARLQRSAGETDAALEATRRFAGDAGHELRTPMTALRANLGLLRRNPDLGPAERASALHDAEREAGRAVRLLDALQTLARGDAGVSLPREPVDLSAVLETALDAARARHPTVGWQMRAPSEELELTGWPDGLRALTDNLLENAARHGRPDGVVEATLRADGDALVLTVDDDGPGVPAAERERLFERFARGRDGAARGSGLGLALVRQQARLHGGEVTLGESPLGGARFEVRLSAASGINRDRQAG